MKKRRIGFLILMILSLIILGLYIFPYLYMVFTSFKTPNDVLSIPPSLFPKQFSMENYIQISEYEYLPRTFLNSLVIAIISTFGTLLISIPAAYGITRYNAKYGRIFLGVVLVTRMIPYISVALPLFLLMKNLKLIDTYLAVALGHMTVSMPLALWLLASFFEGIPSELEEAAKIDGCSRLGALLRVIIPISLGGIAVTAMFSFLASWNDFLFSLFLTSVNTKTIPLAIAEFNSQYGTVWGIMTSLATIYSLPVIFVSFFLQKMIVAGATMGAVKG